MSMISNILWWWWLLLWNHGIILLVLCQGCSGEEDVHDLSRHLQQTFEQQQLLFPDCMDVETYYYSISSWTRGTLMQFLNDTHRQALPYTDQDKADVWKALGDLDRGDAINTVRLIYSQEDVPFEPHGTPETWNREHLWPQDRRSPDVVEKNFQSDLHHVRPEDSGVNSGRGKKYFGRCLESCKIPGTPGAALDTASDTTTFQPPQTVRGDIARALFYIDLRYGSVVVDNNDDESNHMQLTDCPKSNYHMAYLSELIEWHMQDPVDESERVRNERVCSHYQGNRNPFVDFPQLVESIYGLPQSKPYSCSDDNDSGSENPSTSTPAPTPFTTDISGDNDLAYNLCKNLSPGDIFFLTVNSNEPDLVALIALQTLPIGLRLYMTDNGWLKEEQTFCRNEGTVALDVTEPIQAGTVFGYLGKSETSNAAEVVHLSNRWVQIYGAFALSMSGDNVFVYCETSADDVNILAGFSSFTSSDEQSVELCQNAKANSNLDETVMISLEHFDNYEYVGPRNGDHSTILNNLLDVSYWHGSNTERFASPSSFSGEAGSTQTTVSQSPGDVTIIGIRESENNTDFRSGRTNAQSSALLWHFSWAPLLVSIMILFY